MPRWGLIASSTTVVQTSAFSALNPRVGTSHPTVVRTIARIPAPRAGRLHNCSIQIRHCSRYAVFRCAHVRHLPVSASDGVLRFLLTGSAWISNVDSASSKTHSCSRNDNCDLLCCRMQRSSLSRSEERAGTAGRAGCGSK